MIEEMPETSIIVPVIDGGRRMSWLRPDGSRRPVTCDKVEGVSPDGLPCSSGCLAFGYADVAGRTMLFCMGRQIGFLVGELFVSWDDKMIKGEMP